MHMNIHEYSVKVVQFIKNDLLKPPTPVQYKVSHHYIQYSDCKG